MTKTKDIEELKKEFEELTGFNAKDFDGFFKMVKTTVSKEKEEYLDGFAGFIKTKYFDENTQQMRYFGSDVLKELEQYKNDRGKA